MNILRPNRQLSGSLTWISEGQNAIPVAFLQLADEIDLPFAIAAR